MVTLWTGKDPSLSARVQAFVRYTTRVFALIYRTRSEPSQALVSCYGRNKQSTHWELDLLLGRHYFLQTVSSFQFYGDTNMVSAAVHSAIGVFTILTPSVSKNVIEFTKSNPYMRAGERPQFVNS